jgi:hypothetical protein
VVALRALQIVSQLSRLGLLVPHDFVTASWACALVDIRDIFGLRQSPSSVSGTPLVSRLGRALCLPSLRRMF